MVKFDNFAWLICRDIGSSLEALTVPSWDAWLSKTSAVKDSTVINVEYMAPLNNRFMIIQ